MILASVGVLCLAVLILIILSVLFFYQPRAQKKQEAPYLLERFPGNPILSPIPEHWWESEAVFNPAACYWDGRVHLLYRAMGKDGISRIGYASSADGITFDDRHTEPVFDKGAGFTPKKGRLSYETHTYQPNQYASGGGWGGCEDPRATILEDRVYMSFSIFESWQSIRLAVTSLHLDELSDKCWNWKPHITMSPQNETNKNWVIFPEKIQGKFAILHALSPTPQVAYAESLEDLYDTPIQSNNTRSGREGAWDAFVRGAASPPIKTPHGWLLLYHGMDPKEPHIGYKVGAMLLDLQDPTQILHRSNTPLLEPTQWYENDWKPGVVYASGAVVVGDDLIVYYGGGDKYIAAAKTNLSQLLDSLTHDTEYTLPTL